MDPIKGTGAVDYSKLIQQNQNQVQGYEDYASMPMVYEPEMQEKRKAAASMSGLTALGIIGAAGVGVVLGKLWGANGLKKANAAIADLTAKNAEITKKLEVAEKRIEELDPAKKSIKAKIKKFFGKLKFWGKKDNKKVADEAKPLADNVKKAADEAKKD